MRAGVPQPQAVAIALSNARKHAPRRTIAHVLVDGAEISFREVLTPELGPWFEAVWRVHGRERAHRREDGSSRARVHAAFKAFVHDATKSAKSRRR